MTVGRMAWTALDLHTGIEPSSATFRDWKIRLVGVEPSMQASDPPRPRDYVITLEVTK